MTANKAVPITAIQLPFLQCDQNVLIPDASLCWSVSKHETITVDTHTVGIPWTWIGVGCTMPLRSRPARMARGNFIWANDLIGGGTSSPSTNIHSFLRTRLWRASDIAKMYCGGFQLKQAVSYVTITLSHQWIFHSVKFPYNPTNQLIRQYLTSTMSLNDATSLSHCRHK
jgi:hypothetical protein